MTREVNIVDPDPDETVNVVGVGRMTLRSAVRRAAAEPGIFSDALVVREPDKDPPTFEQADLAGLAALPGF